MGQRRRTEALTKGDIDQWQAESGKKKSKIAVGDPNGLTLVIMQNGAKYWVLRYSVEGKQKEITVGRPYPVTSLLEARRRAKVLLGEVASGVDPAEKKFQQRLERREKAAHTFAEAANAWHEHRSQAWSPSTANQVREYLEKDLIKKLGRRPLASITTMELASFLDGMGVERQ